jgi:hypothetical protein
MKKRIMPFGALVGEIWLLKNRQKLKFSKHLGLKTAEMASL